LCAVESRRIDYNFVAHYILAEQNIGERVHKTFEDGENIKELLVEYSSRIQEKGRRTIHVCVGDGDGDWGTHGRFRTGIIISSLTSASEASEVGTAALLGEQQRVLHHLLRVASRLELSAQTVLVHGLHHLAAARRWSGRPSTFHRGETRQE
jgi:hypothetical protein